MSDDMHCTTVEADLRYGTVVDCTCGWRSVQLLYPWDAEKYALTHRLAVAALIPNPLLDAWLAPPTAAELNERGLLIHMRRREVLTSQYAWAIPTEGVIRALAELSPICDLGCGTGYWASLLQQAGAEVLAVDAAPPLEGANHWHREQRPRIWSTPPTHNDLDFTKLSNDELRSVLDAPPPIAHFTEIVRGDAATFDVPSGHALMLCWPPYDDPMAEAALSRYRGDCVIYIGESALGCTGSDAFHAQLEQDWKEVATYEIPQWQGIHDAVYVYRRRAS
jgi:SAM-dependent methyltransferase